MESTELTITKNTGILDWIRKYFVILCAVGGIAYSLITFWNTQKSDHGEIQALRSDVAALQKQKADAEALKATDDKVNRQYDNMSKSGERITVIEKALEYQRGVHDAMEQAKQSQSK